LSEKSSRTKSKHRREFVATDSIVAHFRRSRRLDGRASSLQKGTGLSAMNETKAATAKAASNNKHAAGHTALQQSYGEIGISAVAAAVRYQGAAKNPAYAPAPTKPSRRNSEETA
jgi:hypothetical protein